MRNEKLHDWATAMLQIIHTIDSTIVGGIGGMGSEDGTYVSAEVALQIMSAFADNDDYLAASELGVDDPAYMIFPRYHDNTGFTIAYDDEFPGERNIFWYDETM